MLEMVGRQAEMRIAAKETRAQADHAIPACPSVFCEAMRMFSAGLSGSSGVGAASTDVLRSGSSKARSTTRLPVITSETTSVSHTMTLVCRAIVLQHSMDSTIGSVQRSVN